MAESGSDARNRRVKLVGILAFAAGAGLTIFLIVRAGLGPVASALSNLGFVGLAIIALAHLPILGLLGAAWWSVARLGGVSLGRFIWARAVRDSAAEALPFSQVGGYLIGARSLALAGADAASAGVSTLVDLTVEFGTKIPYLLIGLLMLERLIPNKAGAIAMIAIGLCLAASALVLHPHASSAPGRLLERLLSRWGGFAQHRQRFLTILHQMTERRRALAPSAVLHFASWVLGAGETWLIFHLMHAKVGLGPALVIDSLVGGMRMLSFFVPGSIGVQEGGYVLLCGLFGLSPATALAFSFARRARDLLIATPILLSWQWHEARKILPPPTVPDA